MIFFGELALLYNTPRAATIIAKTDGNSWFLDRQTFNFIVKEAASKKRQEYEDFLGEIHLLKDVNPYEKSQIADALVPLKFKNQEYVVKEVFFFKK